MKSKIVLCVVAASIAVVPMAAFAKSERTEKQRHAAHHMPHQTAKPSGTTSAIPSAMPVKTTAAPAVAPKTK